MARAPMKIIALAQSKGGASKSTTAIHLACEAIHEGESAAILDMDEGQQSSVKWAKRRAAHNLKGPQVAVVKAMDLQSVLQRLRDAGAQWAFIDLPGRDAPVSSAGIVAADFVIIPTRADNDRFRGVDNNGAVLCEGEEALRLSAYRGAAARR